MLISLVIGGAGFVGSHLVDALLARGRSVRVLDNLSTGTLTNLRPNDPHLEFMRGDVNDREAMSKAVEGVAHVFHLATPSHTSYGNMPADRWVGSTDTLNVLTAAHEAGVKRVIYSSCESVYGPTVVKPLAETDPTLPLSPYAFAKLTGEQQCVAFSVMYGLETVRLRYFNVFGPRQVYSGARPAAISDILKTMLLGRVPTVEGDADERQDFIYVDDVVHANLLAAEAPRVSGKVYNIARGRSTTLNEVVTTINAILGSHLHPRCAENHSTDSGTRLSDIARAEVELGFCAGTDLEQGLRQSIAYYKAHPLELDASRPQHLDGPHFPHGISGTPDCMDADDSAAAAGPHDREGPATNGRGVHAIAAPINLSTAVDTVSCGAKRVAIVLDRRGSAENT